MNTPAPDQPNKNIPLAPPVRFWHLAIIILCFAALFTGEGADDYKHVEHSGFLLHGGIGISVFIALCLYIAYGLVGPQMFRLSAWFPFTKERLQQTKNDLVVLTTFKLPEHKRRQGLAGLVQFLGILVFSWLAITGTFMYLFLEPGAKAHGLMSIVKEAHEIGTVFVPVYLCVHVGAVIAHALTGHQVWKEIFFLKGAEHDESVGR